MIRSASCGAGEIATAQGVRGLRVEALGLRFHATVGRYDDGRVAEIFLVNHEAGSMAGILASDSAVLCSIALQHGVSIETLRHALMRDGRGKPSGPLGVVLDQLAQEEGK